jgi:hypothetical protein
MGSVSAPLLAATSAALLTLVLSIADKIRWDGLALLLLMAAALAFIGSVQLTFWAKRFVVTPAELADWWPDREAARDGELEWEQRFHQLRHGAWASRARWAYNAGILFLLAALPVMLLPPGQVSHVSHARLAAIALACVGLIIEAVWITLASLKPGAFDPVPRGDG